MSNHDLLEVTRIATELAELVKELNRRLAKLTLRVTELEKHSHPPIDHEELFRRIVKEELDK